MATYALTGGGDARTLTVASLTAAEVQELYNRLCGAGSASKNPIISRIIYEIEESLPVQDIDGNTIHFSFQR